MTATTGGRHNETHAAYRAARTTREEAHLGVPHLDDVRSTIRHVVQMAEVVKLRDSVAAREFAQRQPLEICLLDPHRRPASPRENLQNLQLLEAFLQFRWHIELIERRLLELESEAPEDVKLAAPHLTRRI